MTPIDESDGLDAILEATADGRHPSVGHVLRLMKCEHLPPDLREVSAPCALLSLDMCTLLPDGIELTVALRKLLEAKDAFVRHAVITRPIVMAGNDG